MVEIFVGTCLFVTAMGMAVGLLAVTLNRDKVALAACVTMCLGLMGAFVGIGVKILQALVH